MPGACANADTHADQDSVRHGGSFFCLLSLVVLRLVLLLHAVLTRSSANPLSSGSSRNLIMLELEGEQVKLLG